MRIYIDTSVIGGCFDPEFSLWSNILFKDFTNGKKIAVVSDQTLNELEEAPFQVRNLIKSIPLQNIEMIELNEEASLLAKRYIKEGVVTNKHLIDAQHIAMATIHRVEIIVSWNFKEMVNVFKIRQYNAVNLKFGYSLIDIRSPKELIYER
jgi:hypothetical protein